MIGAIAWIALGVAGLLLYRTEQQVNQLAASLRTFDHHAREASDALAEARVAQHGYVAAGQGEAFWMTKVSATTEAVAAALGALRQSATAAGRTPVDEAAVTAGEFSNIDQRVRDYLKSGQPLMAADVIFTEGSDAAATAGRQVATARLAEHQAFDSELGNIRRQQAIVLGTAAGVVALVVLLLIPSRRAAAVEPASDVRDASLSIAPTTTAVPAPALSTAPAGQPPTEPSLFRAAADIATDFGRVRDLDELARILGRAADLLDASGLMVWMGDPAGTTLRPVLAHGYSSQMIARIPPVSRTADNAAAKAYRSGTLQIVLSRPGGVTGAVVAPIMSADGCVGALSAEIRGGAETSETIQGLAAIFAAHLAGVLGTSATATDITSEPRTAAQG
jgi:hypothetical protein